MIKDYLAHRGINKIIDLFGDIENDNNSNDENIRKNISAQKSFEDITIYGFKGKAHRANKGKVY